MLQHLEISILETIFWYYIHKIITIPCDNPETCVIILL